MLFSIAALSTETSLLGTQPPFSSNLECTYLEGIIEATRGGLIRLVLLVLTCTCEPPPRQQNAQSCQYSDQRCRNALAHKRGLFTHPRGLLAFESQKYHPLILFSVLFTSPKFSPSHPFVFPFLHNFTFHFYLWFFPVRDLSITDPLELCCVYVCVCV